MNNIFLRVSIRGLITRKNLYTLTLNEGMFVKKNYNRQICIRNKLRRRMKRMRIVFVGRRLNSSNLKLHCINILEIKFYAYETTSNGISKGISFATNFFLSQPRRSFNSNYEDETIYREIDPARNSG